LGRRKRVIDWNTTSIVGPFERWREGTVIKLTVKENTRQLL